MRMDQGGTVIVGKKKKRRTRMTRLHSKGDAELVLIETVPDLMRRGIKSVGGNTIFTII